MPFLPIMVLTMIVMMMMMMMMMMIHLRYLVASGNTTQDTIIPPARIPSNHNLAYDCPKKYGLVLLLLLLLQA